MVEDEQNDLFNTLLSSFIPAVIWLREGPPAGDPCVELSSLVGGQPLGKIPNRVFQERQDAEIHREVPWHLGQHVTLLWDDPHRPPTPDADPANLFRSSR